MSLAAYNSTKLLENTYIMGRCHIKQVNYPIHRMQIEGCLHLKSRMGLYQSTKSYTNDQSICHVLLYGLHHHHHVKTCERVREREITTNARSLLSDQPLPQHISKLHVYILLLFQRKVHHYLKRDRDRLPITHVFQEQTKKVYSSKKCGKYLVEDHHQKRFEVQ